MSTASTSPRPHRVGTLSTSAERSRRAELRVATLVGWDVLVVLAAILVAAPVARGLEGTGDPVGAFSWDALLLAALAILGLLLVGTYRHALTPGGPSGLARMTAVSLSVSWITWIILSAAGGGESLAQMAVASVLMPIGWAAGRAALSSVLVTPERVLLLGSGLVARRVIEVVRREPRYRLDIVGCLDDEPDEKDSGVGVPVLGGLHDLPLVLRSTPVDRVVVAFSRLSDQDMSDILRRCDEHRVELDVVPRLFDVVGPQPAARSLGGLPMLGVRGISSKPMQRALKRGGDIVAAAGLLLLASPLLAVIALLVKLDGGPVFFRQIRVGRAGRLFRVLKFRTMVVDAERRENELMASLKNGDVTIDDAVRRIKDTNGRDPRVTRVGDFLRRTSLDELPQLWNVLVGEMSLVGPRPLRPFEVESLRGWQQARQSVRPGITGLWQVLGRSEIDWAERMQLDYDYARHWSFTLDLEILLKTVRVVLLRRGAA